MLPLPKLMLNMFKRNLCFAWVLLTAAVASGQSGYRATFLVDGTVEKKDVYRSHTSLESFESGASVVYATSGADLTLTRMRLNKTSGSSIETDRRETGRNSVVLADGGSRLVLEYCDVNSHTAQADGLSASGEGTVVTVVEGNFNITRATSAAINATNSSKITVQKPNVYTYSNQSPSFYACRDGKLEVSEAKGDNTGLASPLFFAASGDIRGEKCRMTTAKWSIGCVDSGALELIGNDLKSGGLCGFMIYGADSKAPRSTGSLILTGNRLTVSEGPLLFITNADGVITLSGNKITCKNDEMISVKADEWGTKGSNQGYAVITMEKQTLNGDVYVDSVSSLKLNLKKGARLNGRITGDDSPQRDVHLSLNKGAKWNFKGDCYITSIGFEVPLEKGLKQLKGKHVLYYDPDNAANSHLGGKEYKTGGGVLRPVQK